MRCIARAPLMVLRRTALPDQSGRQVCSSSERKLELVSNRERRGLTATQRLEDVPSILEHPLRISTKGLGPRHRRKWKVLRLQQRARRDLCLRSIGGHIHEAEKLLPERSSKARAHELRIEAAMKAGPDHRSHPRLVGELLFVEGILPDWVRGEVGGRQLNDGLARPERGRLHAHGVAAKWNLASASSRRRVASARVAASTRRRR